MLFLHGTFHAAWSWTENFLDYFSAAGFAAYALSFRGHGDSEGRERLRFTRIRDFVADVAAVVEDAAESADLVGHSMGGFVAQKYLEGRSLPGLVLVASAPPRGLSRSFFRAVRRDPLAALKGAVTLSLRPVDRGRRARARAAVLAVDVARRRRSLLRAASGRRLFRLSRLPRPRSRRRREDIDAGVGDRAAR